MSFSKLYIYRGFLLLLISFDETANQAILSFLGSNHSLNRFWVMISLLLPQVFFAPLQSGYSDFYCRKKSLLFSLIISLISLIFLYITLSFFFWIPILLSIGYFCAFLKGSLGNVLPIARSELASTNLSNFRFSMGLSTCFIAFGYLFLYLSELFFNRATIVKGLLILSITFSLLILLRKIFFNKKEEKLPLKIKSEPFSKKIRKEFQELWKDFLSCPNFNAAILAYLFWEISFYVIFILDVDMRMQYFKTLSPFMIIGYLIGVFSLIIFRKKGSNLDRKLIIIGYYLSLISVSLMVTCLSFGEKISWTQHFWIVNFFYFIYSFGFGWMVPCLFSLVSKNKGIHKQGKIYGLIDSVDTIAFAVAALIASGLQAKPFFYIIFSVAILLLGLPYGKFYKQRR